MKLKEFLGEYMPLSKGAVKIPIQPIITNYRNRYEQLQKNHKDFSYDVYKTREGRMIVHVKVPSESLNRFYYDVLIELEVSRSTTSIEDCDVRFFSNCPSFVYTYAYVFYHLDPDQDQKKTKRTGLLIPNLTRKIPRDRLLVPGVEEKLPDDVLEKAPVLRNPRYLTIPDKSIYHAIFFLQTVPFDSILRTRTIRTDLQIFSAVEDFDSLMTKRKQVERKEKEAACKQRKKDEESVKTTERTVRKINHLIQPKKPTASIPAKKVMTSKSVHKIKGK